MKIQVPKQLDLFSTINFVESLRDIKETDSYDFDFGQTSFVEPFGMLLLSEALCRFKKERPTAKKSCSNFQRMTYAGHMGLFKSFGLDWGNEAGEANGSSNYIPITSYSVDEIVKAAADNFREVGDEVEAICHRLASVLCGEEGTTLHEYLTYSLRELMRNVVEHSESDCFLVCAQYWQGKGLAELAIIDHGIGLKDSFSRNPHVKPESDKDAINYALMPAISGKAFKGDKTRSRSMWVNSGFGLYMTSRICRNGGNFFIGSGDAGVLLTSHGDNAKRNVPIFHQGTVARMRIETNNLESLRISLERFRNEGREFAAAYNDIVKIEPSAASMMLREDFSPFALGRLINRFIK